MINNDAGFLANNNAGFIKSLTFLLYLYCYVNIDHLTHLL